MRRPKPLAFCRIATAAATMTFAMPFATIAAADTTAKPPMKMDEAMPGEMKKPGMKKGDVKKAGDDKQQKMKPMMEKEEQATPASGAGGAKK